MILIINDLLYKIVFCIFIANLDGTKHSFCFPDKNQMTLMRQLNDYV